MSYRCLAEFFEQLGRADELVRVEAAVDAELEVARIAHRVAQSGGPALLFGAVNGHELPLVVNLLATESRTQIEELLERADPESWFEKVKPAPSASRLRGAAPRTLRTGESQQVVRLGGDVDLHELPVGRSFPWESHPAITAGQAFTASAGTGAPHVGRYDFRVLDRDRLAVGWHAHDEPARLLEEYRAKGQPMPLAVVLGGDPVGLLAAEAPLPPGADVSAVAGLLRGKPCELVKGRTIDLAVPADAEIVIEGFVDPAEPPGEVGRVVTPSGHCRLSPPAPLMRVTALTHRANPVLPAMIPGRPPTEATVIRRALHYIFLPLARLAIPELVDYDLPSYGAARHAVVMSFRKTYAGQARTVAHAVWGFRRLMFARLLVLVDEEVDVRNPEAVWAAVSEHVDPGADVLFQDGPPDPLDAVARPDVLGRRMALDATQKLSGERRHANGQRAETPEGIRRLVSDRWAEYGL
jgi:4-hydroxy-3-polyprenylbenzoate decarboxylase